MEKVTTPYSSTDLRMVFIDTKSYIDSLNEEESDTAVELKERSNYEQLVEPLNTFGTDK